jgi:hypothetical protein
LGSVLPGLASSSPTWAALHEAHSVQFYADDSFLVDELSEFIGQALTYGCSAVKNQGLNLPEVIVEVRYLAFDTSERHSQRYRTAHGFWEGYAGSH